MHPAPNIHAAMARPADRATPPKWWDLKGDMWVLYHAHTPDTLAILWEIVRFRGELWLDESVEMPHSLSPETMLRRLAAQALYHRQPESIHAADIVALTEEVPRVRLWREGVLAIEQIEREQRR